MKPSTLLEFIAYEYDLHSGEHLVLCDAGTAEDLPYLIESSHRPDCGQARRIIDRCFKWRDDRKTI